MAAVPVPVVLLAREASASASTARLDTKRSHMARSTGRAVSGTTARDASGPPAGAAPSAAAERVLSEGPPVTSASTSARKVCPSADKPGRGEGGVGGTARPALPGEVAPNTGEEGVRVGVPSAAGVRDEELAVVPRAGVEGAAARPVGSGDAPAARPALVLAPLRVLLPVAFAAAGALVSRLPAAGALPLPAAAAGVGAGAAAAGAAGAGAGAEARAGAAATDAGASSRMVWCSSPAVGAGAIASSAAAAASASLASPPAAGRGLRLPTTRLPVAARAATSDTARKWSLQRQGKTGERKGSGRGERG